MDERRRAEDGGRRTDGEYRIRHRRTFGIEQGISNNEVRRRRTERGPEYQGIR